MAWLLIIMIAVYAPRSTPRETEVEMRARFAEIARDVAVTIDRDDPIQGLSKDETGALMLSLSFHESGWRVDVDRGETSGGHRDFCLMQIRDAARDVREDRLACLREGLKLMKASWRLCKDSPERDRLAAYASGRCSAGLLESEAIVDPWRRWLAAHPPPRRVAAR